MTDDTKPVSDPGPGIEAKVDALAKAAAYRGGVSMPRFTKAGRDEAAAQQAEAEAMEAAARSALLRAFAETREALAEVVRRAALPIESEVNGLPSSEAELASAINRCSRLVVDHVVETARRALASGGDHGSNDGRK